MLSSHKGFTLVEIMVTICVFSIAVLALVGVQVLNVKSTGFNGYAGKATMVAQGQMETLRKQASTTAGFPTLASGNQALTAAANGIDGRLTWTVTTVPALPVTAYTYQDVTVNACFSCSTACASCDNTCTQCKKVSFRTFIGQNERKFQ